MRVGMSQDVEHAATAGAAGGFDRAGSGFVASAHNIPHLAGLTA